MPMDAANFIKMPLLRLSEVLSQGCAAKGVVITAVRSPVERDLQKMPVLSLIPPQKSHNFTFCKILDTLSLAK
jgi:hypothetical protein